jgi:peptidoglycan/xylan/chitin deacetylase (PgdA/CDA1 family)
MRFDSPIQWPNGARCAVMLTFDLDAELVWLDMDPGNKDRPKTLSIGEYGPRRGVDRILDVLDRNGLRTSWMVPGLNAGNYEAAVRAVAEAGHEVGNHGYHHENFGLLSREQQRDVLLRANEALEKVTGTRPIGYRTPAGDMTADTPELLVELGFTWSSSTRGDDRPYFVEIDDKPSELVEIAAHWELDDFPYFMFNYFPPFPAGQGRIASYSQVLGIWKTEFDAYYDMGLCFVVMFHPQTIGTPGRIQLLEELIAHIKSKEGVWFATGAEVADWWRKLGRPNDPGSPAHVFAHARRD